MAADSADTTAAPRARRPWAPIPDHVPKELVFDVEHYMDPNDLTDPFGQTKNIYQEIPPLFYAPVIQRALYEGTWVVTHYEDIREVYQNDELYSTADVANFQETYAGLLHAHAALMTPHQAALNAALADLLANPERAAQMGARAQSHAESRHDAAKAALTALEPLLPKAPRL